MRVSQGNGGGKSVLGRVANSCTGPTAEGSVVEDSSGRCHWREMGRGLLSAGRPRGRRAEGRPWMVCVPRQGF